MLDRAEQVAASKEGSIYRGSEFAMQEIELALGILGAEIKTLRENFDGRKPVNVKLAAERTSKVANQISTLSAVLARTFKSHTNRHATGVTQ